MKAVKAGTPENETAAEAGRKGTPPIKEAFLKKAPARKPRGPKGAGLVLSKIKTVPRSPGVYLFSDAQERVIYVGKAKDLTARLRSYCRPGGLDARKRSMVEGIREMRFIVTDNELEALALEANLIKQHRPRYNVILRDDKNYPYLRLSVDEKWPRLSVVRRVARDGALYFGPYVPSSAMREALHFIRRNFGLRPCRYSLEKPMRPCIQHQMGRCTAPCAGLIDEKRYMGEVREVEDFLRGRRTELLGELRERMQHYSEGLKYEDAARMRDRIAALTRAWESQKVIAPELGDLDVVGHHAGEKDTAFVVFFIRGGIMIGSREFFLRGTGGMKPGELYHSFVEMLYAKDILPPPRIITPVRPGNLVPLKAWLRVLRGGPVKIMVPGGGKELELVGMAGRNARVHYEGKSGTGGDAVLLQMKQRLSLSRAPRSIGAFDVSNIQGSDAVGAFVLWEDGDFSKQSYRHLKIKTVGAPDDYAMMRETIRRTLRSLKHWPDLLVIDGGKGHLGAALGALDEFSSPPEVVALAKKPERIFTPASDEPVSIGDRSGSSLLLRRIRDEVHRFAIGFHKKLRERRMLASPLKAVRGVGDKRRLALLREFGSLERLREATPEEIASVRGIDLKLAGVIKAALAGGLG